MSKKNLIIITVGTLLCLLLYFAPWFIAQCEAAETEKVYTITATELTNLEVELNRAQKAIENSKSSSATLAKQLEASKQALAEAKEQLTTLREQLEASSITLKQQQIQLASANESLTELSKEMKQQQRSLERQRNIAYIIAVGLLYAAVR